MYACMYACMYVCMYACMCVCVYVYVYVNIYIYNCIQPAGSLTALDTMVHELCGKHEWLSQGHYLVPALATHLGDIVHSTTKHLIQTQVCGLVYLERHAV